MSACTCLIIWVVLLLWQTKERYLEVQTGVPGAMHNTDVQC